MLRTVLVLLCACGIASASVAETAPSRQLFLFMFRPGPAWVEGRPMAQQDLKAHGAYHETLVREGKAVGGGGYVGMDGGLAIVRAVDLAQAQAMLEADPAILNGVFVAEIRQWRPRYHSDKPLVEAMP